MTFKGRHTHVKFLEGTCLLVLFALFVHLTTSEALSLRSLALSLGILFFIFGIGLKCHPGGKDSAGLLWILLSALGGGFWFFNLFRVLDMVEWPLGRAADLTGYARLLYFHVILSLSVLTPLVLASRVTAPGTRVSWGNWKGRTQPVFLKGRTPSGFLKGRTQPVFFKMALWLSMSGVWLWAILEVLLSRPSSPGPFVGFACIGLLKAALTGATEEICYRGIIQPEAVNRYGVPMGILLQSFLYTLFHMHLGEVFFSYAGFLAGVMALGLIFGMVTRMSRGIGWACAVHTALNLVIEWRNLSLS